MYDVTCAWRHTMHDGVPVRWPAFYSQFLLPSLSLSSNALKLPVISFHLKILRRPSWEVGFPAIYNSNCNLQFQFTNYKYNLHLIGSFLFLSICSHWEMMLWCLMFVLENIFIFGQKSRSKEHDFLSRSLQGSMLSMKKYFRILKWRKTCRLRL
jgi:hypothetical protein